MSNRGAVRGMSTNRKGGGGRDHCHAMIRSAYSVSHGLSPHDCRESPSGVVPVFERARRKLAPHGSASFWRPHRDFARSRNTMHEGFPTGV